MLDATADSHISRNAEGAFARRRDSVRRRVTMGAWVVVLSAFCLYAGLRIDPRLVYHYQAPVFLTTRGFLEEALGRPGGPVEYVSLLLSQFFYWRWAGAAILTLVAAGVCLATRATLKAMAGRAVHPVLALAPAVLLLLVHNHYPYRLFYSVGMLAAAGGFVLYDRTARGAFARRLAAFVIVYAVLYYLAAGSAALFAVLCGIRELAAHRRLVLRFVLGPFCLLVASLGPLATGTISLVIDIPKAFEPIPPFPAGMFRELPELALSQIALVFYLPLAGLGLALLGRRPRQVGDVSGPNAPDAVGRPGNPSVGVLLRIASFALLLVVGGGVVVWTFREGPKRQLDVARHVSEKQWEAALRAARRVPAGYYAAPVAHDVNRALCHVGRLPSDMFKYPQPIPTPSALDAPLKEAELSFDLGRINCAQHWASLAYYRKPRPRLLAMLVKINVLKGRPRAARTYLNNLGNHLLYRRWTDRLGRRLDADPNLFGDPELDQVRKLMLDKDYPYGGLGTFPYHQVFVQCLRTNRKNRMAFEYLMAFFLLNRELKSIASNIKHLDDFDYAGIPVLYEEAVLLYQRKRVNRPVNLRGREITLKSRLRFRDFEDDMRHYQSATPLEKEKLLRRITRDWRGSYFFYYAFETTGRRKKRDGSGKGEGGR